jgi:phospholipase C
MVLTKLENREIQRRMRAPGRTAPGQRPRPGLPEGTDLLPQIRHIVVLMMENHSYDNYLGTLAGRGEGLPAGPDGRPEASNPGQDGTPVAARRLPAGAQAEHVPSQSWYASHRQWNNGANDGFAASVQESLPGADPGVAMGYWTEDDLPFYHGLARTFPLADHWFASCLGPTFPNRRFLLAGTAHGLIDDLPFDLFDYPPNGTVFDQLTPNGISWANYHHVTGYGPVFRRLLGGGALSAARRLAALGSWWPPLVRTVRGNKSFTADLYPIGLARTMLHLRHTERFFADAAAGSLPAFSIVDPDFGDFSEENPQDIRQGESFAAKVVNAVMHGKGWPHTLLIWTYDEHGGYHDHVPPPAAPRPDGVDGKPVRGLPGWLVAAARLVIPKLIALAEQIDSGPAHYDRYGFRVPTVIVSPYARPNFVTSQVYDHTSILKLVQEKWNLPPLTHRDAAALSPLEALDFDSPPAFLTPPDLPEPALAWGSWSRPRRRGLLTRRSRRET